MKVYHFTNNIRVEFNEFYEYFKSLGVIICFDFEDSISSDGLTKSIDQARNLHRDKILEQLMNWNSNIGLSAFGFRINRCSSNNYKEDIQALCSFKKVDTLFVPKVETKDELIKILRDITFSVNEIIPIIETKRGFLNAKEILSITDSRYKRIAFGHCDYNLSIKQFPFFHHDKTEYWEWISTLNDVSKEFAKEIVNSPVLELENEKLIHYSRTRCQKYSQVTGHISLCKMHTEVLSFSPLSLYELEIDLFNPSQSPEMVISAFEQFKVKNKTFALTGNRKIISPQERVMASIRNNK